MKIKLNPTRLKIKLNSKKIDLGAKKKEEVKPYPIYKGTKKALAVKKTKNA